MASVFLSYSREDVAKAQAVATALERLGHSVWWDRQVHGGSRFSKEIERALKRSDAVLVLWSRASIESAWVQDEAAEGRDSDRLVAALIDDCKPPLGFRQYQAVDLSAWKGRANAPAINMVHQAILAKGGVEGEPGQKPPPPIPRRTLRTLGIALASLAVVALCVFAYWLASPAAPKGGEALSLRLGSFETIAGGVQPSVADTLREELLNALGTDAILVSTAEKPASAEGFALNATVRKVEDQLRFTVHVVNEGTGASVWSETLDRGAEPPDLAPRQVAVSISQVLRCGLGGAGRYGRPMPDETLSLYFNFCEEYWSDTLGKEGSPSRALDLARRVVAAAPDFSRGWSGLGLVAIWSSREGRLTDAEALRSEARKAAERALELDDENSQGYEVLAILQPPFAFAEREKLHVKSVTVRPGECGCEYVGYGDFLSRVGRNGDAVDALKRAHDMIPLSADVNSGWADALFVAGRADEAREVVAKLLELWPENSDLREILVRSALWTGTYGDAEKLLGDPRTPVSGKERSALRKAFQALRSGSAEAKAGAVAALIQLDGEGQQASPLVVTALAALGAGDQALALTARRIESDGPRALAVLFEPPLEQARHSPMFAQIAQKFGLVDYWRQSKQKPDFCEAARPPQLCARL